MYILVYTRSFQVGYSLAIARRRYFWRHHEDVQLPEQPILLIFLQDIEEHQQIRPCDQLLNEETVTVITRRQVRNGLYSKILAHR